MLTLTSSVFSTSSLSFSDGWKSSLRRYTCFAPASSDTSGAFAEIDILNDPRFLIKIVCPFSTISSTCLIKVFTFLRCVKEEA